MKRHESLAPLSRDHHANLILAQSLKKTAPPYKGIPKEPLAKAAWAQSSFHSSIQEHFEKEETLLEKVKTRHPEIQKLAGEITEEHRLLKEAFLSLNTSTDLISALDKLGWELEKHIRKEERVLFPMIEQHCSAEDLDEIRKLLQ